MAMSMAIMMAMVMAVMMCASPPHLSSPSALGRARDPHRPARANSDSRRPPITVHPELLDADGRITEEELLTVRFSGDNEPSDPGGSDDHAS